MEKINSRPEGSGRKGDNYQIKKKDTREASFIYRNKNKEWRLFKYYASHYNIGRVGLNLKTRLKNPCNEL